MINQREIDQFDLFTLRQNLGKLSYLKLGFDKSCHIFLLVLKNTDKGQKLQRCPYFFLVGKNKSQQILD